MRKEKDYIQSVKWNWFWSPEENSEGWEKAVMGQENVVEITEHSAAGEGDKWYYDIEYVDGTVKRVFNPNEVIYKPVIE